MKNNKRNYLVKNNKITKLGWKFISKKNNKNSNKNFKKNN